MPETIEGTIDRTFDRTIDRARTPLLSLITAEAIDRDYQAAASRRGPAPATPRRGSRFVVLAVVAVFGGLVGVAAAQTTQNADIASASRAELVERVNARSERVAALEKRQADLRADNVVADRRVRGLGADLTSQRTRASRLGALTGFEPVIGDGVRVVVEDAPRAGGDDAVRDSDLALLVDALFSAGADAVAINGQRLTALSAIRNSGDAVEVNGVGVASPYTVQAIGDPDSLAADLVDTPSGLLFAGTAQRFGFTYDIRPDDAMRLPAAPAALTELRWATTPPRPQPPGGGSP